MPALTFRRAGPADAAAVRDLTRAAYAKWCAVIGREPKPMTTDYDRAVRDHLIDLLVEESALMIESPSTAKRERACPRPDPGEGVRVRRNPDSTPTENLLGMIEMIPHADHLLIENVAVSPAAQGRGIGRHLMQHAERTAADLCLPQVRLYTNKAFDTNLRFYATLGYRVDREEPYKGGFVVHLSKPVSRN